MITVLLIVLITGSFVVLFGSLWVLVCSEITYRHRIKILDAIYNTYGGKDHAAFMRASEYFDAVDYNEHMWRLARLQSPWSIYSPEIKALVGAA